MFSLRRISTKNLFVVSNALKNIKVAKIEPVTVIPRVYLNNAHYVTQSLSEPKPTVFRKIKKMLGIEDLYTQRLRAYSALLYEKIVDTIDFKTFFEEFEMQDSITSWFVVVELHVWMAATRLMADKNNGKMMRDQLIEFMWQDFEVRLKKLGTIDRSVKRDNTMLLAEQMNATFVSYDEGIMSSDKVLAGALWRRFLAAESNNPEHLEKIVCYVRKQMHKLDQMPLLDLLKCEAVKWDDITKCTQF